MLDTTIQVKTDHFDGPLGLLLLLVQKEEMDIRKLNLTKITQQYLGYLSQMRELNFDVAGDYLFLAATLLHLKSKTAITEEEVARLKENADTDLNITSEADLIKRLEELQHYQRMGEKLWALDKKGHEIFVKPKINRKAIVNSILVPMEVEKLTEAMIDFIIKEKRKYTVVRRDKLSIKEKLQFLKSFLKEGEKSDFETLLDKDGGKTVDNTVITFISLLELARLKRLTVFQNEGFGTIYVQVIKSLEDFDVESANGFDEEDGNNTPSEEELKATIDEAASVIQ
ncbi:MAG: segregation/condensation protein A [Bdellovibrionota bacterium]|jgi:segregation and condensation protein A|nr:segregation/condensation protein A [Bdellovibrionota bacterium]